MSEEERKIVTTVANANTTGISIEEITSSMGRFYNQKMESIERLCSGVTVIPDELGILTNPNGYAVIVGKKLWEELKNHKARHD